MFEKVESIIKTIQWPKNIKLFNINEKAVFHVYEFHGGLASFATVCLITPDVDLDGGEFQHRMNFNLKESESEADIYRIISEKLEEIQNCPDCNK